MPQTGKLPTTKSDSVAVGDCEERVSAKNEEKQPLRPRAVRSTPSSRSSPWANDVSPLLLVNDQPSVDVGEALTIANVLPETAAQFLAGEPSKHTSCPVLSFPDHL